MPGKLNKKKPGVGAHACNLSTQEAEAGLSLRLAMQTLKKKIQ